MFWPCISSQRCPVSGHKDVFALFLFNRLLNASAHSSASDLITISKFIDISRDRNVILQHVSLKVTGWGRQLKIKVIPSPVIPREMPISFFLFLFHFFFSSKLVRKFILSNSLRSVWKLINFDSFFAYRLIQIHKKATQRRI